MAINNKNKRLEITLTDEEMKLLTSLSSRFSITKTQVIKQALKVFASKRKHYLTISYKECDRDEKGIELSEKENQKPMTKKESDDFQEVLNKMGSSNTSNEDDDDLPF